MAAAEGRRTVPGRSRAQFLYLVLIPFEITSLYSLKEQSFVGRIFWSVPGWPDKQRALLRAGRPCGSPGHALSSRVTLGKFLDLSEHQFSRLCSRGLSSLQDSYEQSENYWVKSKGHRRHQRGDHGSLSLACAPGWFLAQPCPVSPTVWAARGLGLSSSLRRGGRLLTQYQELRVRTVVLGGFRLHREC